MMNISSDLIGSGLESDVYRIKDGSGRGLILKKRKPTGKQNYLFEAYAYRQLKGLGALVPKVIQASSNELLLTQLAGTQMDDRPELYTNEQLFASIAKNLSLCNAIAFQGFGVAVHESDSFTGKYATWLEFLNATEQLFDSPAIAESELEEGDIVQLRKTWNTQKTHIHLEQGKLVHGDFAMSSLFVEGQQLTGIIDFGDAFIGDPLMDIAYFRFKEITKPYGEDIYQRLLRHYAKERDLIVNDELEQKIIFYMIYWGLKRLEHCPDLELKRKFVSKLRVVASNRIYSS